MEGRHGQRLIRPISRPTSFSEEEVPMTRRSGAFAMATASMLLLSAVPAVAQDASPASSAAAAGLPVADCAAPADPIGVAVFRFDNDYLSLIREAIQVAAD